MTSTFTLRGRSGTYDTGLALVARLVPGDAARLCVAGVALGDIQLRDRPGTYVTGLALVARLAPGDAARLWLPVTPLDFARQAWHDIQLHFAWQG